MWRGLTRFGQRLGRGEVSRRYLAKIPSNESLKPFYALGLNIGGQVRKNERNKWQFLLYFTSFSSNRLDIN